MQPYPNLTQETPKDINGEIFGQIPPVIPGRPRRAEHLRGSARKTTEVV